jgi:hypothetical protein
MAWLYKHPRSQFWQIGWRVGNKLFNRSTKVANRADAEKKLALFDLMADASREKRLSEDFFNSLTGRELGRIALPLQIEMPNVITHRLTLPGIGIECYLNMWMDGNVRTTYATFDIMLGTTSCDLTAGGLIKSQ